MANPVEQGVASFNESFVSLAEHWDPFVSERIDRYPNFWHDRIPRGSYQLYSGLSKTRNVYRGGLMQQGGLDMWSAIAKSNGTSINSCVPPNPVQYTYAWQQFLWSGKQAAWGSAPLCLEDLKFQDAAPEQVAFIISTGVDYGISMQEVWNRELYISMAVSANRACIMTDRVEDFVTDPTLRFVYDPTTLVTDQDGNSVPALTYSSGTKIGTLNYEFLDFLREDLSARAFGAALSRINNMPTFGWCGDCRDFERMVMSDPELRQDWRWFQPSALIDSYNMSFKNMRGWMIIHDPAQMRFRILSDNGTLVTATRVYPMVNGVAGIIGNIPQPNPLYYKADLAVAVVFLNDVVSNEFVPSTTSVGSGTYFGPQEGLNGKWQWLNILDKTTNPLGLIGNFYGRMQIFAKPGLYSTEATAILYRRCPQVPNTGCRIDNAAKTVQSGTGVAVAKAAVAADIDLTNKAFWLTLVSPIAVGPGSAATVTFAAANGGTASMVVACADCSEAPKYKFTYQAAEIPGNLVIANLATGTTVTPA